MVVIEFEGNLIGDNGILPDGNIGERSCMHENGLSFKALYDIWFDGVNKPSSHCAVNL